METPGRQNMVFATDIPLLRQRCNVLSGLGSLLGAVIAYSVRVGVELQGAILAVGETGQRETRTSPPFFFVAVCLH